MQCPNCGFENIPGLKACARCQSSLNLADVDVHPPRFEQGGYRRSLRMKTDGVFSRVRLGLDEIFRPLKRTRFGELRFVDILSLFIPGLPQLRVGMKVLSRVLLILWITAILLIFLTAGTMAQWWFYSLALGVHCTSIGLYLGRWMMDTNIIIRLALGLLIFLSLHYLVYSQVRNVISGFINTIQINNAINTETLSNGDVLLGKGRYLLSSLERGELVLYHLQLYGHGGEGAAVDRIIGLPGDILAIKKGQLLINGNPSTRLPLGDLSRWPDVSGITAEEDEYLIVPSMVRLEIHGYADTQMNNIMNGVLRVKRDRIIGIVFWRIRPLDRFGPLE